MEAKKVYESIAQLLNNIVKQEQLRYELSNNTEFRHLFVKQINNMLALENEHNQIYNNVTWAMVFGKSIVKITEQKQRIEKPENKSIEDIYADYSAFISFTTKTFIVGRNQLVDDKVKFTEQDVIFNSTLTEDIKQKYKAIEDEKKAAEQAEIDAKKAAEAKDKKGFNSNSQKQDDYTNTNNNNNNYYNSNGFNAQANMFNNMPIHPMQDPRFYPYNQKPKWMPMAKYAIAILAIIAGIMLIVQMSILMTTKIDYSDSTYATAYGFSDGIWKLNKKWGDIYNNVFPTLMPLAQSSLQNIMSFFLYLLPPIYLAFSAFKKPRNIREKYRAGIWPIFFTIIFFATSIMSLVPFVSDNNIKSNFGTFFKTICDLETISPNINGFWDVVMTNYGHNINVATSLTIVALTLLCLTVVAGIVLIIFNPRVDQQKVAFANMEFQKATAAMMQGQHYEINPSIYENNEEVINAKEGKITTWFKGLFNKKKK